MESVVQINITPDELQELMQQAIRNEVPGLVANEINRILSTPTEDRLINRSEAMSLLGIKSRTTMGTMEKNGTLNPISIGGQVSYRLLDIQDLIQKRTRK